MSKLKSQKSSELWKASVLEKIAKEYQIIQKCQNLEKDTDRKVSKNFECQMSKRFQRGLKSLKSF